jgi:AraC-like DNA-binding protein
MMLSRPPQAALRPFIKTVWASHPSSLPESSSITRERVLPTGNMHLVFRLSPHPLRLFDDLNDSDGHTISRAVVGGARSSFYVRDISEPVCSVGAELYPGASQLLFGVPADELAGRHTVLSDMWGSSAESVRERLAEMRSAEQQLTLFESLLMTRLPQVRGLHPAVAQALEQFTTTSNVREVVKHSGYSHRRFIALFQRAVGLTPKRYCRLLRFQNILECIAADDSVAFIDLALAAGYSDQAHFNREFQEFTGVTPTEYRQVSPLSAHHLPVLQIQR